MSFSAIYDILKCNAMFECSVILSAEKTDAKHNMMHTAAQGKLPLCGVRLAQLHGKFFAVQYTLIWRFAASVTLYLERRTYEKNFFNCFRQFWHW